MFAKYSAIGEMSGIIAAGNQTTAADIGVRDELSTQSWMKRSMHLSDGSRVELSARLHHPDEIDPHVGPNDLFGTVGVQCFDREVLDVLAAHTGALNELLGIELKAQYIGMYDSYNMIPWSELQFTLPEKLQNNDKPHMGWTKERRKALLTAAQVILLSVGVQEDEPEHPVEYEESLDGLDPTQVVVKGEVEGDDTTPPAIEK